MRELYYDIEVGDKFVLPALSWQVDEVKGQYAVMSAERNGWGEVHYICENIDNGIRIKIDEMCLAYIMGEEVEASLGVIYDGTKYQPTYVDCKYHLAVEDMGIDEDLPFWYCGYSGNVRSIRCDLSTSQWCYFRLPWD